MKYPRSFRRLLVICAGMLSLGLLSQSVQARSTAAITGLAASVDMPCLSIFFGTLTNNCARVISLDVPLVVDDSGAKSLTVSAFGAGPANNVGCRAEGLNKQTTTGFFSNGGAYAFLPSFGASADIVTGVGAFVPVGGQLLVNCQINQGGRVDVINWTP